MRLRIVAADGDPDPVISLYRYLCQDAEVGSTATLSLDGCADDWGGLCTGNEELNVGVANSVASVSTVLDAVSRWRSTRSWAPELNVESNTTRVVVASDDPVALREAAEQLLVAAPR